MRPAQAECVVDLLLLRRRGVHERERLLDHLPAQFGVKGRAFPSGENVRAGVRHGAEAGVGRLCDDWRCFGRKGVVLRFCARVVLRWARFRLRIWRALRLRRKLGVQRAEFGIREPGEEGAKLAVQPPRGVIHRRTGRGIPRGSGGIGRDRGGRVMRQQLLDQGLHPFLRRPPLPRKAQFEDAEFEELQVVVERGEGKFFEGFDQFLLSVGFG